MISRKTATTARAPDTSLSASERLLYVLPFLLAAFILLVFNRPAEAMQIQTVKSPGGIEAWLVEDHSNPMMAMRFSFDGGSAQDPAGKDGVANFVSAMLDEGAGELDAAAFQERLEDLAVRLSFSDSQDAFYGNFETLTVNRDAAAGLLAAALNKPHFDKDAAADQTADPRQSRLRRQGPGSRCVRRVECACLRRSSLWPARKRHGAERLVHHSARPGHLPQENVREIQPARGGRWRHQRR
jgi:Insulinase (Peptidase family M16)